MGMSSSLLKSNAVINFFDAPRHPVHFLFVRARDNASAKVELFYELFQTNSNADAAYIGLQCDPGFL